jgi:hypothetical protein
MPKKQPLTKTIKKKKAGPTPYVRIRSLGKERVDAVNRRLLGGDNTNDVAAWMQKEWPGETADVAVESLSKQLQRYKRDVLGAEVRSVYVGPEIPKQEAARTLASMYGLEETVDGLSVMNEMIAAQRERIWKMFRSEEALPFGLEGTKKELRELFTMVKEFYELQFEMGLIARVPKQLDHKVAGVMKHTRLGQTIEGEIRTHYEVTEATQAVLALLGEDYGDDATSE